MLFRGLGMRILVRMLRQLVENRNASRRGEGEAMPVRAPQSLGGLDKPRMVAPGARAAIGQVRGAHGFLQTTQNTRSEMP